MNLKDNKKVINLDKVMQIIMEGIIRMYRQKTSLDRKDMMYRLNLKSITKCQLLIKYITNDMIFKFQLP